MMMMMIFPLKKRRKFAFFKIILGSENNHFFVIQFFKKKFLENFSFILFQMVSSNVLFFSPQSGNIWLFTLIIYSRLKMFFIHLTEMSNIHIIIIHKVIQGN